MGRRTALKGAAALAAGAAGLVVANSTRGLSELAQGRAAHTAILPATALPAAAPATAGEPSVPTFLTLYGRQWALGGNRRPGTLPVDGERAGASGELLAAPDGEGIGSFNSALFFSGNTVGGLEIHTFQLADGLLVGLGTSAYGEGTYAVVGGTGRFTGAAGSYHASQQIREVGGDGSAKFDFTLTGGVRNGP